MSVQENHIMFLLLLLDPAVHNSSVKCDRMKSQKVRRRPESCHSYHAQVSISPHHDTSKNTYIHTTLLQRKYYNNKYYKNFSNVKAEHFFLLKLMPAKKTRQTKQSRDNHCKCFGTEEISCSTFEREINSHFWLM